MLTEIDLGTILSASFRGGEGGAGGAGAAFGVGGAGGGGGGGGATTFLTIPPTTVPGTGTSFLIPPTIDCPGAGGGGGGSEGSFHISPPLKDAAAGRTTYELPPASEVLSKITRGSSAPNIKVLLGSIPFGIPAW